MNTIREEVAMFGFFARIVSRTQQTRGLPRRHATVEELESRDAMTTGIALSSHSVLANHLSTHVASSQLATSPITTAEIQHNLDQVNHYRSLVGAPPLKLDLFLSFYAVKGSQELLADHSQHKHFNDNRIPGAQSAETQSYVYGYPLNQPFNSATPARNVDEQIDKVLAEMWAEGPGGGHHDIMANPNFKYLGVGLIVNPHDLTDPTHPDIPASYWNGALYLTNDFMS
jgi:uncharacterized protein YkwD